MAEAVFQCFFPGIVRPFGKTGSHSRESRATLRAQIQRAKTPFRRGEIRRNGTAGTRRGHSKKKQKLPHKKEPPHFLSGIPYGLANGGGSRFRSILCQGCAVRPAHTPQIKKKTPPDKLGKFSFLCRWWGSNPHVLLAQGILSFYPHLPSGVIQ